MQKIQVLNGLSISYNEGLEQEKLDNSCKIIKQMREDSIEKIIEE